MSLYTITSKSIEHYMNIYIFFQVESFVNKHLKKHRNMLINQNGFREYDARWLYKKDIDLKGVENLGKGLGTQVINRTCFCNAYVGNLF